MIDLFTISAIGALISSGLAGFWTKIIKPGMIFTKIGRFIEDNTDSIRYGKKITLRNGMKWDMYLNNPIRFFLKGAGCIYCVSTWFVLPVYILVIHSVRNPIILIDKLIIFLLVLSLNYIFTIIISKIR